RGTACGGDRARDLEEARRHAVVLQRSRTKLALAAIAGDGKPHRNNAGVANRDHRSRANVRALARQSFPKWSSRRSERAGDGAAGSAVIPVAGGHEERTSAVVRQREARTHVEATPARLIRPAVVIDVFA